MCDFRCFFQEELTPAVEAAAKSIIARMVPAGAQPKITYNVCFCEIDHVRQSV
jgi:hypothetical protein